MHQGKLQSMVVESKSSETKHQAKLQSDIHGRTKEAMEIGRIK